jgi:hypothetical protein
MILGGTMSKPCIRCVLFVLACAAAVAGCGQRSLSVKKTYAVTGTIKMNGEPVAFAIVHFGPKDGKGAEATGFTNAEGMLVGARTYSNTELDGIVPGEYAVTLESYNPLHFFGTEKPEGDQKPTVIPPGKGETGQVVTIESNDDNQVNLDL